MERINSEISPISFNQIDPILLDCLINTHKVENKGIPIPSKFDFTWCRPAFDKIIGTAHTVSVLNPQERESAIRQFQKESEKPEQSDLKELMEELHKMGLDEQDSGERSMTVVASVPTPDEIQISFGPITLGDHKEVRLERDIIPGVLPILEIHTHPYEALFSPNDYFPMIADIGMGDISRRSRLLYAAMVICPNSQFLALATSKTTLLPLNDASDYIDQLKQESMELYKIELQKHDIPEPDERELLELLRAYKDDLFKFIPDIKRRLKSGDLASCGYKQELTNFLAQTGETGKLITEQFEGKRAIENRIWNMIMVDVSRRLNITLYTSNNLQDFTAATA